MKYHTRFLLSAAAAAICTLGLNVTPAHAGCFDTTEVRSRSIDLSPALECLAIDAVGNTCQGGVELTFTNNCESAVTLTQTAPACDDDSPSSWFCEPRTLEPGEALGTGLAATPRYDGFENGEAYGVAFDGVHEEVPFSLTVSFVAETSGIETGCALASPVRPASSAGLVGLGVLGLAAVWVRRRAR